MEQEILEFKMDDGADLPTPFKEAEADFDAVRSSMLTLIEQGNKGLQCALDIAIATEQPRAIDSFAGLLKVVSELNAKVIELHKAKAEMAAPASGNNIKATTVNQTANNFFAGSTDDLQRMLAEMTGNNV